MCGIVGYIGHKEIIKVLLDGIKRLEYRGYDSSGIAVIENGALRCEKAVGKIAELERSSTETISTQTWESHIPDGQPTVPPTIENAHPHIDCKNEIAVVHNGIIENYDYLKTRLEREGHIFRSETDTEVLAHLIEKYFHGNLETAVMEALKEVEGTYGIAVISPKDPQKL